MKLLEPLRIKKIEVKNRVVMPPMGTMLANKDGTASEALIEYYSRRAKGGAGLIIVEATGISSEGVNIFPELKIFDDKFIKGLTVLTRKVKGHGTNIGIQIYHPGRQAASYEVTGVQPVGPSPIRYHPNADIPHPLSADEIAQLVDAFSEGARRAREAGFDIVELHGAHGYLINEFLSPLSNRRTDGYGGDSKRRTKFAVEIVERVRQKVGSDYPIFFRLSADEYEDGGLKIDEAKFIAQILVGSGVDVIDVSAGTRNTIHWTIQPMMFPRGCIAHLAGEIRRTVAVPIITAGRINNPDLAEAILTEGKADLIGIGRGLLADPDFPQKVVEGTSEDIQKCIGCNTCADEVIRFSRIQCAINPETGNEGQSVVSPTSHPKKVMVIGGGPAGLTAAIVLAERGHEAVLYEKDRRLGGQLNLAGAPSDKKEFMNFVEYLKGRLIKHRVKILLGKEVSPETTDLENFDEVVVATGAYPIIPKIKGMDRKNVVTAKAVLEGNTDIGKNILVIGGNGTGCSTALYLAQIGMNVTVIEALSKVGRDIGQINRWITLSLLKERKVSIHTDTVLEEITDSGAIVKRNGSRELLAAETFVIAMGVQSENRLFEYLKDKKVEVHIIGDSRSPRKIINAVHEAWEVASKI